ncbi:hypothetical protein BAUCODRAFT_379761 [Baudoinia panamericana UAMH 10762]|uniref:Uncharacterized protein n=1 Tax=Baudoinia panamericana (strain UAMH 10762) TaxID=717646 RepID=M2MPR8_BAUPA|nr:uncharacterized protein BAUCODRAFT_379761 [Baudoinia panamericana UAMH 10762]EMC98756.1 hypothetical protein BAUCODRAFT_379761 [Baudoinia panamericana UAMH 10762]
MRRQDGSWSYSRLAITAYALGRSEALSWHKCEPHGRCRLYRQHLERVAFACRTCSTAVCPTMGAEESRVGHPQRLCGEVPAPLGTS